MGVDLITVGYTINKRKAAALAYASPTAGAEIDAQQVINTWVEQVRTLLHEIDYNEYLTYGAGADENGYGDDGEDLLAQVLYTGWMSTRGNGRYEDAYDIPGTDNVFVIAGGDSAGEDPFDGFSDLCLLLNAVNKVPEFGLELGILGTGIRL